MNINDAIDAFIAHAQKLSDARFDERYLLPKPVIQRAGGEKFLRIAAVSTDKVGQVFSNSAFCFIALQDVSNRTLGEVKAGDVLKAAGWKAPARGKRGTIFGDAAGYGITGYGAEYR